MPRISDVPTTEYVRFRIRQWESEKKNLQDLEAAAGTSSGFLSQVKHGKTGIGPKSGAGLAHVFGFPHYPAMQVKAIEWWQEQGHSIVAKSVGFDANPQRRKAIEATRDNVHAGVIETFLEQYGKIEDQDWMWYVQRIWDIARGIHLREDAEQTRKKTERSEKARARKEEKDKPVEAPKPARKKRSSSA